MDCGSFQLGLRFELACGDQKTRMSHHAVVGAHGLALDVPRPYQSLEGSDHAEAGGPQRFDGLLDLGDRGQIAANDSPRGQRSRGRAYGAPR